MFSSTIDGSYLVMVFLQTRELKSNQRNLFPRETHHHMKPGKGYPYLILLKDTKRLREMSYVQGSFPTSNLKHSFLLWLSLTAVLSKHLIHACLIKVLI